MGSLTRTVSPSVVSLTATPNVGQVIVSWPAVANTFGQVVQTLTRTPPFSGPVTPAGTSYIDTAVTGGASYTYSLVVTDARGLNSFTPAVSATVPSTGGVSKKWNPGFYAGTQNPTFTDDRKLNQQQTEQALVLSSGAKVLGWQGIYNVGALATATPGVFDFSKIFRDVNALRSMATPKRLMISLQAQQYGGQDYTQILASSVYNNSAYGPSPTAGKYGWWSIHNNTGITAALHRAPVMDWVISLVNALAITVNPNTGLTLDDDPYVEAIFWGETGHGQDSGDVTYSAQAYEAQMERLCDALASSFKKTVCAVQNNFLGGKAITQTLTNYMYSKGIAQSGPDTFVLGQHSPELTAGQLAAIGVGQTEDTTFTGPDLRGKIGMMSCTQGPETSNPARYTMYTPMTFFNQINNVLKQSHAIITMISTSAADDPIPAYPATGINTGANPGNWHSFMQVINGQSLTHKSKPTSVP